MRPALMPVEPFQLGPSAHQTDGQELVGKQGLGERKIGSYVQGPRLLSLQGRMEYHLPAVHEINDFQESH
jgi:hypothetical protein